MMRYKASHRTALGICAAVAVALATAGSASAGTSKSATVTTNAGDRCTLNYWGNVTGSSDFGTKRTLGFGSSASCTSSGWTPTIKEVYATLQWWAAFGTLTDSAYSVKGYPDCDTGWGSHSCSTSSYSLKSYNVQTTYRSYGLFDLKVQGGEHWASYPTSGPISCWKSDSWDGTEHTLHCSGATEWVQ